MEEAARAAEEKLDTLRQAKKQLEQDLQCANGSLDAARREAEDLRADVESMDKKREEAEAKVAEMETKCKSMADAKRSDGEEMNRLREQIKRMTEDAEENRTEAGSAVERLEVRPFGVNFQNMISMGSFELDVRCSS